MHYCDEEPTTNGPEFFDSEKEKRTKVDRNLAEEGDDDGDEPLSIPKVAAARPPPRKPKFVSASLPCSATSSPQNNSIGFKKFNVVPPRQPHPAVRSFARQSSSAVSRFALMHAASLSRSKSCGEGRSSAPTDEFDILSGKDITQRLGSGAPLIDEYFENSTDYKEATQQEKQRNSTADFFKCSALCLYLPSFSKKKSVQLPISSNQQELTRPSTFSLERFECASWSSGIVVENFEGEDSCYFDLPLELIRSGENETDSPVRTAFVFESDRKGALKKSMSRLGASSRRDTSSSASASNSSTSSSSACITPRLQKAREDFNAFLEAQN
ncbi:uncharacterized protein [Typha angustifolia]|uniref:uncharacterized protein n=1 Tax=Typha angustifolia TaxID=59011 RepID=UPI003C2C103E